MKQKMLSLLLAVCMVIGLLPATALAVDVNTFDLSGGNITIVGSGEGKVKVTYGTSQTADNIDNTDPITITSNGTSTANTLTISTDAVVRLKKLTVATSTSTPPVKLTGTARVKLLVSETNVLTVNHDAPAILVPAGASLTIEGDTETSVNTLSASNTYSGETKSPTIGGSASSDGCGTIVIGAQGAQDSALTVNASGQIAIGVIDYGQAGKSGYDITIHSGVVNASGKQIAIGGGDIKTARSIAIHGGTVTATVDATGSTATDLVAIGGNGFAPGEGETAKSLSITIDGGTTAAYITNDNNTMCTAIGSATYRSGGRTITIGGSAVVNLGPKLDHTIGHGIGGGDNSQNRITIQGDAKVSTPNFVGSRGAEYIDGINVGFAGGTIEILGNAQLCTVYEAYGSTHYGYGTHIGGSAAKIGSYLYDNSVTTGGDGGSITINTTGRVGADTIGGGTGADGGDGGNITIQNGILIARHIGGGIGTGTTYDESAGLGGSGGTITISGGTIGSDGRFPSGETMNAFSNKRPFVSAGIGGGGGATKGGDGGTITITGGKITAYTAVVVYDESGNSATSGHGAGGAAIGGGNGGDGGTITISGGKVDASASKYGGGGIYPQDATTADALPAIIGGGSKGGAGSITISGGTVLASNSGNDLPVYDGNATSIGQGMGYTGTGGAVKVTGGSVQMVSQKKNPRPTPWPTSDGTTPLYPAGGFQVENLPADVDLNGSKVVSCVITPKGGGAAIPYGVTDMTQQSTLWLPVGDTTGWATSSGKDLYDVTLKLRLDNTVYTATGVINYYRNPTSGNLDSNTSEFRANINLAYQSHATVGIALTSAWGDGQHIYNGTDQKPTFTVKDIDNKILTENTDYTLKIEWDDNDLIDDDWQDATAMKNAGKYRITATGKNAYAGMEAKLGFGGEPPLSISPKYLKPTLATGEDPITKPYDGDTLVKNADGTRRTLNLQLEGVEAGDSLTNVQQVTPIYATSSVGTGIGIQGSITCNGNELNNYHFWTTDPDGEKNPTVTGTITVKTLGPTSFDTSGLTVSKTYNGNTDCALVNVTGTLSIKDLVGAEVATATVTAVSAYDTATAGTNKTVTLTVGNLGGANAGNYELAGGSTTIRFTTAIIAPADYTFNLTEAQQRQDFTQGGGLSQINLPENAKGIGSQTVAGTVTLWHDEACTETQATDDSVKALGTGEHSLYVKFVPASSESNYTDKVTTGEVVVLHVVEGAEQTMSWSGSAGGLVTTYGTGIAGKTATTNDDGGTITYSSSDTAVATADASTGALTIVGAGSATITAKAAKVEGVYRETSITYPLTVSKKSITVTAEDKDKTFGADNPSLTISYDTDDLVSGDDEDDLAVTLSTAAIKTSPVVSGGYAITGTSTSANYDVTVTPGTLTVSKADAPTVADPAEKTLLYSVAHTDVDVAITGLPADCGTVTFTPGSVTDTAGILDGAPTGTATGVRFSTVVGNAADTATIPVTVTMQNYEDATVDVVVKLVDKSPVVITLSPAPATVTYGDNFTLTATSEKTPVVWSSSADAVLAVANGVVTVKAASATSVTVTARYEDETHLGEASVIIPTVAAKALTVKPKNLAIYNGEALPTAFELEYVGLVTGDTLTPVGTPTYALEASDGTPLTASTTNGSYVIKWTNPDGVTLTSANYTITKTDGTLTISSRPSGGGDGGGAVTPPKPAEPEISTGGGSSTATVDAPSKTTGNTTNATVNNDTVKNAIQAAEKAAASNGTTPALEIKAEVPAGATELVVTLPKTALDSFSGSKAETMTITSGLGEITLPADTAASIAKQAGSGNVKVTLGKVDPEKSLSEKQRAAVGDAPVYDIAITAGSKHITGFDGGLMTIALPYTLKPGENPAGVVIWYVDEVGNIQKVTSMYDTKTKTILFTTNHLSLYAIGYEAPAVWENPFADVAEGVWYYDAVQYVHQNELMSGTGGAAFGPEITTSRGMVVTILYRLEGKPAVSGTAFPDVEVGSYYGDAVLWAAQNKIVGGYTNGSFGPNDPITREQMATILMNYAKHKGYDVSARADLGKFNDSTAVSDYAKEAMAWANACGIMSGKNGNLLDPAGNATRAEAAALLLRFSTLAPGETVK